MPGAARRRGDPMSAADPTPAVRRRRRRLGMVSELDDRGRVVATAVIFVIGVALTAISAALPASTLIVALTVWMVYLLFGFRLLRAIWLSDNT